MSRLRDEYDDDDLEEDEYDAVDEQEEEDEEDEEEEEADYYDGDGKTKRKRSRSDFIDEEEDDDGGKRRRNAASQFFDDIASVDSDDEDDETSGEEEDGFIDRGDDIPDENDTRTHRHRPFLPRVDEQDEDVEEIERQIQERYRPIPDYEFEEEETDAEQQALLPSVRDPKLWMVKCAVGREREVAVCLMQKCIDSGSGLQIRSAIALDHLKNFIYIEADKEAHVREAVKGMRNIYPSKLSLVPIKEMADVLSVKSRAADVSRDTWVRMKIRSYKGDLAKVVDVDNVRQRATVKLIPRIDLQALANKLEGIEVQKKKAFLPPARLMNIDEARELNLRVESKRDRASGDYYEKIEGMLFKDGFLYKNVSLKSVRTQNLQPTFDELEKFRQPGDDGDMISLSTLFANRKKGHFMNGDRVIVVKGDLRNLKGCVEKVEDDMVHIKPNEKGLPRTLAIRAMELCKYFEPGNHVKVVSGGATEGVTGMVVSVEGHVVNIVSDTTKELLRVFVDNVVESSEVASGVTRIGNYELHDLVLLHDNSFGVIIRVESEAFHVLKGVADRPDVELVRLREIKHKIDDRISTKDRFKNTVSVKDVVKIVDGPCRGKQGSVEHIYKGMVFINDRHHLEHAGFICVRSESCMVVGGNTISASRFGQLRTPQSPMRPPRMNFGGRNGSGRGRDSLIGSAVKIRQGDFKGCKGRVVDVKGAKVRVELESQMRVVEVDRSVISDNINVSTPLSRHGIGSETPVHPSRTPLHPYMTPIRDSGVIDGMRTPLHPYMTPMRDSGVIDGMRTPMRDRAWNPMSPPRDSWEDANPGSWGTPSSTRADVPSPYLPSTPMTAGGSGDGLDMMTSPAENEGPVLVPDILVNIRRAGEDSSAVGVIKEVIQDGSCKVALGSSGNGETVNAVSSEMVEVVAPRKADKIKIIGGEFRGSTGKLIGIDGTDGIVKVDDTFEVKILDMAILAKLVPAS